MSSSQPSTKTSHTANALLHHIPQTERPVLLKHIISFLRPDDEPGINFVAQLVASEPGLDAERDFISFLERAIRDGHVQTVVDVSVHDQRLRSALLSKAVDAACEAKSNSGSNDTLLSYLLFSNLTASRIPWSGLHSRLLRACLDLLHSNVGEIHNSARGIVLELLAAPNKLSTDDDPLPPRHALWDDIQTLLASNVKLHVVTGYSIWLRWLVASSQGFSQQILTEDYWQLIRTGLRHGDVEQRKLCLNILKLTVVADAAAVPVHHQPQYIRYATVFETMVLGRYTNQVLECRPDLNFLAERSDLDPSWLYVLLGAALDSRMQDSNRKFVGNWIMHAGLAASSDFIDCFRDDFLPWAIQGQHFVSTLKRQNEQVLCTHGQHLVDFIERLGQEAKSPSSITDIVVDTIMRKRNTMFAYCTVYLVEAIKGRLDTKQKAEIAALRGLPEVARDYILLNTAEIAEPTKPSTRQRREQNVLEKLGHFEPSAECLDDIWSDVEYLEFPKRVLMTLPAVLLGGNTLQAARQDSTLATCISKKFDSLVRVAETKTFLFPPLAAALRKAVTTTPEIIEFIDIAGFIIRVAEHPPEPTTDLMLEEAIILLTPYTYEHYFGDRLSYGIAAYLDVISRLHGPRDILKKVQGSILIPWRSQKVPPPTMSAWKNALQLQVLILCLEHYSPSSTEETQSLLADLFHILAIEPLPCYRYLLEALIVQFVQRHGLGHFLIARLQTKDHHSNPKHLASLMKIGAILACSPDSSEEFSQQLATAFVPLAASSKVVIRHEAQWQVPILMDHARARKWSSIIDSPALGALDDYIRSLERFHDPPLERQIGSFDPAQDHNLTHLVEGRWHELDSTETPLTTHADFVKIYKKDPLPDAPASCIPLGQPITRTAPTRTPANSSTPQLTPAPQTADTVSTALQTKGTAYLARALSTPTNSPTHRPNPHLIVLGSLVDNPHNLGGLSRVSEIFGAAALTLQNQNVVADGNFKAVSVSSHLHLPIVQLSATGVPAWLRERRKEGFCVVGIEQTDRSVVLGSDRAKVLPEKCVLVVGSEKEGIPAGVLVECEVLVEIPQCGVTRSLNVQTAVGIVLFEWSRHNRGNGGSQKD